MYTVQRQRLGLNGPVVCKPKYSMTSLCSTAAPDCRTGQTKADIAHAFNLSRCLQYLKHIFSIFFFDLSDIRA